MTQEQSDNRKTLGRLCKKLGLKEYRWDKIFYPLRQATIKNKPDISEEMCALDPNDAFPKRLTPEEEGHYWWGWFEVNNEKTFL